MAAKIIESGGSEENGKQSAAPLAIEGGRWRGISNNIISESMATVTAIMA